MAAPAGSILSLATIDGQVLALAQPSSAAAAGQAERRPLAGGSWTDGRRPSRAPTLSDPTDLISTQAGTAAVLDGASVLVTKNGGLTVHHRATPALRGRASRRARSRSPRPSSLALLMAGQGAAGSTEKVVYTSASGGASGTKAGAPSREGDPGTLAGGSPSDAAAGRGQRRELDLPLCLTAGKTWTTALTYGDGGLGWADLGFTTPTDAVVDSRPGRQRRATATAGRGSSC